MRMLKNFFLVFRLVLMSRIALGAFGNSSLEVGGQISIEESCDRSSGTNMRNIKRQPGQGDPSQGDYRRIPRRRR